VPMFFNDFVFDRDCQTVFDLFNLVLSAFTLSRMSGIGQRRRELLVTRPAGCSALLWRR
jgi:hypothetical protein